MNEQDQTYMNGHMPYQGLESIGLPHPLQMHTEIIRQQERMRVMDKKVAYLCRKLEGLEEMKASYANIKKAFWIVLTSALGLIVMNIASKISISM